MVRIIRTTCRTRHIEIRPVRSNFLCVAPAAWCITISRRGDPSQKSWRIRGLPFFGLGRDDPPPGAFDPATGLNTALDEGKRGSQVSPLGNFSCLTIRLQRSDDVQWVLLRKTIRAIAKPSSGTRDRLCAFQPTAPCSERWPNSVSDKENCKETEKKPPSLHAIPHALLRKIEHHATDRSSARLTREGRQHPTCACTVLAARNGSGWSSA
jgi:hypothetical protein